MSERKRRHMPGKPLIPSRRHHRSWASVHSSARSVSPMLAQASIVAQKTPPATPGRSSPLRAAMVASSASARPSSTSPRAIRPAARPASREGDAGPAAQAACRSPWRALPGRCDSSLSAHHRRHAGLDTLQPAVAGILRRPVQQLFGALQPGLRHGALQPEDVVARQVERDPYRGLHVTGLRRAREGSLTNLDGDRQLTRPPRRLGQQLERFGR